MFKIGRCRLVPAVIVALVAPVGGFRDSAWDGTGPIDPVAVLQRVVGTLRRPAVSCARLVFHYRKISLLGPLQKVGGMGVAYPPFVPAYRPNQMKPSVTPPDNARVPHQFIVSHLRLQQGFPLVERLELIPVPAEGQMQPIFPVSGEIRKNQYAIPKTGMGRL